MLVLFLGDIPTYKRVRSSFKIHLSSGVTPGISLKYQAYKPRSDGTGEGLDKTSDLEQTSVGLSNCSISRKVRGLP